MGVKRVKIEECIRQSFKLFAFPRGVLLYCLFGVCFEFLMRSLPALSFLLWIFISPLVQSLVFSWFFIESINPQRLNAHKQLQTSFYFPLFRSQFFFYFVPQIIMLALFKGKGESLAYNILSNTFYVFWCFLVAAIMFQKNHIVKALRQAFGTIRVFFMLFIVSTGVFVILDILKRPFKHSGLTIGFPLVLINLLGNILELAVIVLLIRFMVSRKGAQGAETVLSGYLTKPSESPLEDLKAAMKRASKCVWLGIFSWIPFVHLFAFYFGYKRFKRQKYGKVRSLFGMVLGAFYTIIYFLALVGFLVHGRHAIKGLDLKYHMASFERFSQRQSLSEDLRKKLVQFKQDHHEVNIPQLIKEIEDLQLDDQEAYFTLGMAYLYNDKEDKAIAMFEKSAAQTPNNGDAFFPLGILSLNYKLNAEQARSYFSRFLEYQPNDKTGLQYLELANNAVAWKGNILVIIFSVIVLIISIILHEFAHSYTAYKCGDPTSKEMGRMSFNPIAHLDPFGSVILPLILIINKSPVVFGWAKPVVIKRENLTNPDRDEVLISLSGCSMNFFLAMTGIVLLTTMGAILCIAYPHAITNGFFLSGQVTSFAGVPFAKIWAYCNMFLSTFVMANLVLGIVNFIPLPPLDGSWLIEKKFSPALREKFRKFTWVSSVFLLILLFTGVINFIISIGFISYSVFMNFSVAPVMGLF